MRYSKNVTIIRNVFRKNKADFMVVSWLAIGYVLVAALLIFNLEPETFETFLMPYTGPAYPGPLWLYGRNKEYDRRINCMKGKRALLLSKCPFFI